MTPQYCAVMLAKESEKTDILKNRFPFPICYTSIAIVPTVQPISRLSINRVRPP